MIPSVGEKISYKVLSIQHPQYKESLEDYIAWEEAYSLKGSYNPKVSIYSSSTAVYPANFEGDITDQVRYAVSSNCILIQNENETNANYSRRCVDIEKKSFVKYGVDTIVGILLSQSVSRDYPSLIQAALKNITIAGKSYKDLLPDIVKSMELFGFVYLLPFFDENNDIKVHVFLPSEVDNWSESNGVYTFIRVARQEELPRSYDSEYTTISKYYYFLEDGWFVVEQPQAGGEGTVVEAGPWAVSSEGLPVVVWELPDRSSPVADAAEIQKNYTNKISELANIEKHSCFPRFCIGASNNLQSIQAKELTSGPGTGIEYDATSGAPLLLAPSAEPFIHLHGRAKQMASDALACFGIFSASAGESGVALSQLTYNAQAMYRSHAEACATGEKDLVQMIARLLNIELPKDFSVSWSSNFGILSSSLLIDKLKEFIQQYPGPEGKKVMFDLWLNSIYPNAPLEVQKALKKEMDSIFIEKVEKKEEPVDNSINLPTGEDELLVAAKKQTLGN